MTDNVMALPTSKRVLADRIRKAYNRTMRGKVEWIAGTLQLAAALAEARAQFPSNVEFSVWLAQMELDSIGKDDRVALIPMAADPLATSRVLLETDRKSWQHIWREELAPRRVRHLTNTETETKTAGPTRLIPENIESEPETTNDRLILVRIQDGEQPTREPLDARSYASLPSDRNAGNSYRENLLQDLREVARRYRGCTMLCAELGYVDRAINEILQLSSPERTKP